MSSSRASLDCAQLHCSWQCQRPFSWRIGHLRRGSPTSAPWLEPIPDRCYRAQMPQRALPVIASVLLLAACSAAEPASAPASAAAAGSVGAASASTGGGGGAGAGGQSGGSAG